MYESFYGLRTRPFGKTPDPAFLFHSRGHGEALARMVTAAEDRDLAVLSGEIGAGKTLLTRAVVDELARLHGEAARVVLIVNPRLTPVELLFTLAERLGVEPLPRSKPKLIDAIVGALYRVHESGGFCLLIVDEAHLLPTRSVFEELRLLLNQTLDDQPLPPDSPLWDMRNVILTPHMAGITEDSMLRMGQTVAEETPASRASSRVVINRKCKRPRPPSRARPVNDNPSADCAPPDIVARFSTAPNPAVVPATHPFPPSAIPLVLANLSLPLTPMPKSTRAPRRARSSDEWKTDAELFTLVQRELYTPVVGDVLDALGRYHQFLPAAVQPIRENMTVAGRAMPVLMIDVHGPQKKPFGLLTEALTCGRARSISRVVAGCAAPIGASYSPPRRGRAGPPAPSSTVIIAIRRRS